MSGHQRLHRIRHGRLHGPASGAIEATGGWAALNAVVVPPMLIASCLVVLHWTARARLAAVVQ